jgi:hypothetical protein
MKKDQMVNPNPYKINHLQIRGMNISVKIENPNGLNAQKISIRRLKKYDDTTILTDEQRKLIYEYLDQEGFLFAAKQHNIYFDDEYNQ